MSEEENYTPEAESEPSEIVVINNQLEVIYQLTDIEPVYDAFNAERIKVISRAMDVIYRSQKSLLQRFKLQGRLRADVDEQPKNEEE